MKKQISEIRVNRLRAQGYFVLSRNEINDISFGIRFAYRLCVIILFPGVLFASIPVLTGMMVIAFSSIFLPYHPFDYIYNGRLSNLMRRPKLPPRSLQLKFACSIATIFLGLTIYFFNQGFMLTGYILGSVLIASAALVSTTDICVPSIIYNSIFYSHKENIKQDANL